MKVWIVKFECPDKYFWKPMRRRNTKAQIFSFSGPLKKCFELDEKNLKNGIFSAMRFYEFARKQRKLLETECLFCSVFSYRRIDYRQMWQSRTRGWIRNHASLWNSVQTSAPGAVITFLVPSTSQSISWSVANSLFYWNYHETFVPKNCSH